jgi:hypothetical protein
MGGKMHEALRKYVRKVMILMVVVMLIMMVMMRIMVMMTGRKSWGEQKKRSMRKKE